MSSFLFLAIGFGLFVLYRLDSFFGGSSLNSLIDLCTIANTSLVLVDERMHGYYLHG